MTQDEVIEMARQVGFNVSGELILDDAGRTTITNRMEAFAKLVAAKEQEAIIQIIKETLFDDCFQADVIEAIRARGEQA